MCFKAPMLALSCLWLFMCFRGSHACFVLLFHVHGLFMCFRGSHACSVLLFLFIVCSHVSEVLMLALCLLFRVHGLFMGFRLVSYSFLLMVCLSCLPCNVPVLFQSLSCLPCMFLPCSFLLMLSHSLYPTYPLSYV